MDIPVLLEPTPTGFRATTGAPLNLIAEGPDKDAVMVEIRTLITTKLSSGTSIESVSVPIPALDFVKIRALVAELAANPFMEEWQKGIQEYRAEVNTIPDPDEPLYPVLNGSVKHADTPAPSAQS